MTQTTTIANKVSDITVVVRIELDRESALGDALALGACVQSLTDEGWHLTEILEHDDKALTAILRRSWEVGRRPPRLLSGDEEQGQRRLHGPMQSGRRGTPS